ncbi:MAG: hypothetical protein ACRD8Z_11175 [Nitrososphaeraceae archaeon]
MDIISSPERNALQFFSINIMTAGKDYEVLLIKKLELKRWKRLKAASRR